MSRYNHYYHYSHNFDHSCNHTTHPIDNKHYNHNCSFSRNCTIDHNPNCIPSYNLDYNHISCIQYHSVDCFILYFRHYYFHLYFIYLILDYQLINKFLIVRMYLDLPIKDDYPIQILIIVKYFINHELIYYQEYQL